MLNLEGCTSASRTAKFGVAVFKAFMLDWGGRSLIRSAKFGVVVFKASMLTCPGNGVNLTWVYVHCAIYEMYLVKGFSTDVWSIAGGVGSICHSYMCIVLYRKLIWCHGSQTSLLVWRMGWVILPWIYVYCVINEMYLVQGFQEIYV